METVYLVCAIGGLTIMAGQFLLGLLGLGGEHHDAGGDHDVGDHDIHTGDGHDGHSGEQHDAHHEHGGAGNWFLTLLTFRTVVAALTFFGLVGMTGTAKQVEQWTTFAAAVAAGMGAMLLMAYMMRQLHRLRADGTARIDRAVGLTGTVYLRIPAQKSGSGKVQLNLQNRTVEYQAVTSQQELPTGAKIVVVSIVSPDTVEVAPATAS